MNDGNYIKINRSILEWEWYKDQNTKDLFLHMLIKANWKEGKFQGTTVPRGSFVSSISKLSTEISLSERQIRTAISHLKMTGEVTSRTTNKFTVFTVLNYDLYQTNDKQNDNQPTSERQADDKQTTTIEEGKKEKKEIREEGKKEKTNTVFNNTVRSTDVQQVIDAWNSLPGLSRIKKIVSGTQRHGWLKARIRDYGLDEVLRAIENVRSSPFLLGQSENKKGWTITFDWFIRPNNFPKVLDGNYNDKTETKTETESNFKVFFTDDDGKVWQ